MNVLSLFDGMSCGQLALQKLGIKPNKYYASEVDKHAIKVTQHNFPDTIHLGDVRDIDVSELEPIHLLMGGSPCQSFSFAGKRKGMSTKDKVEIHTLDKYLELKKEGFEFEGQSYLFWEYMRILTDIRKYNPNVFFLLENVEMGKKWERVLSEAVGLFGVHINSALVSAQNRKRIYWTNIRTRTEGMFGDTYSDIPQPKDRGILLKDILESEVPEKYYLSEKMLNYFSKRAANFNNGKVNIREKEGKASCLTSSMSSCDISDNFIKVDTTLKKASDQDKASCFTAGGNSGGNHSDMDLICVQMVGRRLDENGTRKDHDKSIPAIQRLEAKTNGKTGCLTSVQKDNLVMQINPSTESNGCQPYQQNRVYDTNGISPALMAQMSCGTHAILIPEATKKGYAEINPGDCFDLENPNSETRRGRKMEDKSNCLMAKETDFMQYTNAGRIRRLTPTECKRLQTVPDTYDMSVVSDTQQYRMLGNGWSIDVIVHILSFM